MKNFYFALCIVFFLNKDQAYSSEAGMPQLNPEFWASQVFWLFLIFIILYLIIWKIFLPKITYSIENRKSRLVNDLDDAQKLKEKAELKLKEYNKIIENSKNEAKKIIDDSKKRIDKEIENKRKKIYEDIEKELLSAEIEIKNLKKSSIKSIEKISSEISADIIKQITSSEVNKSSVSAVVSDITKKEAGKHI